MRIWFRTNTVPVRLSLVRNIMPKWCIVCGLLHSDEVKHDCSLHHKAVIVIVLNIIVQDYELLSQSE